MKALTTTFAIIICPAIAVAAAAWRDEINTSSHTKKGFLDICICIYFLLYLPAAWVEKMPNGFQTE